MLFLASWHILTSVPALTWKYSNSLSPHCIINLIYGALWCRPRPSPASCVSHVQSGDKLRQQCFFMWPLCSRGMLSLSRPPRKPQVRWEGASFRRKFSSSMMQRRWWQEIQPERGRCDGVPFLSLLAVQSASPNLHRTLLSAT